MKSLRELRIDRAIVRVARAGHNICCATTFVEIRSIRAPVALKAAVIVFAVLIGLRFLWLAHAIFIVTFLGILLGLASAVPVDFLERHRVRRAIGAPLTILVGVALIGGISALIAPSIREQTHQLSLELPKAWNQIERTIGVSSQQKPARTPQERPSVVSQPALGQPQQEQQQETASAPRGGLRGMILREIPRATKFLFPIISTVLGAISGLLIILFIAMYIAADPGLYRKGLNHLVPHKQRARAGEVLDSLTVTLRQWLLARFMAMVVIGLVTGLGLTLLRVKGALALGVLAGLLELIPFFGPFVSAVPAIGIALVDSPQKALTVAVLYLIVQQLEGSVISPLILEKRLHIPPVMTVVAVAAMGMVFGVLGMLIAEPLLAAGLVLTKMLYVNDVIGDEVPIGKT